MLARHVRHSNIMIIDTDAPDHSASEAFRRYEFNGSYDEMFRSTDLPRKQYRPLYTQLLNLGADELRRSKQEADQSFFNQGITFTVYGSEKGTERIFPHDLLPRIITAAEWARALAKRIWHRRQFTRVVSGSSLNSTPMALSFWRTERLRCSWPGMMKVRPM